MLTNKEKKEAYKKCRNLHKYCPQCGLDDVWRTCMGFIMIDFESHKDSNYANCKCGWSGRVYEMVGKKPNQ